MAAIDIFNDIFNEAVKWLRPPIGAFGNYIVFEVSTKRVRTYDDYRRQSKARYARHELVNQTAVSEYLGRDLEQISFTMTFNRSLGVEPLDEAERVRELCHDGIADYFILGNRVIGDNLWVISEVSEAVTAWDHSGHALVSNLDVTLTEYVETYYDA